MFDRKSYKKNALEQLKKRWSIPVLVSILITLIMSLCNIQDVVVKVKAGSIFISCIESSFQREEFSILNHSSYFAKRVGIFMKLFYNLVCCINHAFSPLTIIIQQYSVKIQYFSQFTH